MGGLALKQGHSKNHTQTQKQTHPCLDRNIYIYILLGTSFLNQTPGERYSARFEMFPLSADGMDPAQWRAVAQRAQS